MQGKNMSILENKLTDLIQLTKYPQQHQKSHGDQQKHSSKCIKNSSLTIAYTTIQKMPISIKKLLEQNFQYVIQLTITNCDLRTFENFPKLDRLKRLNASKNSLRGSFEFLVKNRTIQYIDISNNMISDVKKFEPLRCLKNLSIYAKQNPFITKANIQSAKNSKTNALEQLKSYGIKYLEKPQMGKKEDKKEEKTQKVIQKLPINAFKQPDQPKKMAQQIIQNIRGRYDQRLIERIERKKLEYLQKKQKSNRLFWQMGFQNKYSSNPRNIFLTQTRRLPQISNPSQFFDKKLQQKPKQQQFAPEISQQDEIDSPQEQQDELNLQNGEDFEQFLNIVEDQDNQQQQSEREIPSDFDVKLSRPRNHNQLYASQIKGLFNQNYAPMSSDSDDEEVLK